MTAMAIPPGWPDEVQTDPEGRRVFPATLRERGKNGTASEIRVGIRVLRHREQSDAELGAMRQFFAQYPDFDPDKSPKKFELARPKLDEWQQIAIIAKTVRAWEPPYFPPFAAAESIEARLEKQVWDWGTINHLAAQVVTCRVWDDPRDQGQLTESQLLAAAARIGGGDLRPFVDIYDGASRVDLLRGLAQAALASPQGIAWLSSQPTSVRDWYLSRTRPEFSEATD